MRRRTFLAGVGVASLSTLAGCGKCGETWTGVGFTIAPTSLQRTSDGWRVDAEIEVQFGYGREGTGVFGAALAGFDGEGRVVGTTGLDELTWSAVAQTDRIENECGTHGRLRRRAAVETDAFPRWVGIRYDEATTHYTEARQIARYRGDPSAGTEPTAEGYEPVSVGSLTPSFRRVPTSAPIEELTFRPGALTCHPPPEPGIRYSLVNTTRVAVEYARSVPAPRFYATLAGYAYGDALRFDVGLEPRPQLQRTDCTAVRYELSTQYGGLDAEPQTVELRHLDRQGEVVRTVRKPFDPTPTSRDGFSNQTGSSPTERTERPNDSRRGRGYEPTER